MAGEKLFTRIPPSSTGARIGFRHRAIIPYENRTGTFVADDILTGASSGIQYLVYKEFATNATTGYIEVGYDDASVFNNVEPTAGENLNDVNANTIAQVSNTIAVTEVYTNESVIVGGDNTTNRLNVDVFGAANTTFSEGAPQLSGFGKLRTTEDQLLANYEFNNNILPTQFSNTLTGSGAISFDSDGKAAKLEVGSDTNALVTHTSNLYHPYALGNNNFFVVGTRVGDTGKTGVVRNWGAFDYSDGFFFQLNGTALRVIHRWTMDGNPTQNMAVAQSAWNRDTLDGTGGESNPSGMNIDVSKANTYWIDYQFIGGGRTRWGVFYKGERIVCHEMFHHNGLSPFPTPTINNPLASAARPICWSMKNTGSPGAGSEFYALGGAVYYEGSADLSQEGSTKLYATNVTIPSGSGGTYYCFALRPTKNLLSGAQNHSVYTPKELDVEAFSSVDESDVKVEVRVFQACQVRGENFVRQTFSETEVDKDGDHVGHGPEIFRKHFTGDATINFSNVISGIQYGTIRNNSEADDAKNKQPLTAITNADPAVATVGANPLFGTARHYFADKQAITVQNVTATDAAAALNGNTYYLSYVDSNETKLYTSTSDIDDDRKPREANLTFASGSSVAVGETITFTGAGTAVVTAFSSNTASLENRTNAALDTGLAGGTVWSGSSGANGTITGITQQTATYPLDYETSLLAVDGSGWSAPATDGEFFGTPPSQPAWVFMIRPFSAKAFDIETRWSLNWRERTQ